MIAGNERLIVVLGMAHSGTTILTYVLWQHPGIVCCMDGDEAWVLENSWMHLEQAEPIQSVLDQHPLKRVLLKRPWNEVNHGDWMKREMPDARFIYCYRNFTDVSASWRKHSSMVSRSLREGGPDHQRETYAASWDRADALRTVVKWFRYHSHQCFVDHPTRTMEETTTWLELPPFEFDASLVGRCDIKSVLKNQQQ